MYKVNYKSRLQTTLSDNIETFVQEQVWGFLYLKEILGISRPTVTGTVVVHKITKQGFSHRSIGLCDTTKAEFLRISKLGSLLESGLELCSEKG